VSILTLTHDGIYEVITGFFAYYYAPSQQIYITDFTMWEVNKQNPDLKVPKYSGELLMLSERKIFVIMLKPKYLQKKTS
jgi:hypothetical protein